MNKNKILKLYLVHFIYVPASIIYSLFVGEDLSVLIFITFLSLIAGGFAFAFNYFITLLGLSIFNARKILGFILPVLVGLIFFYPIKYVLQYLDFGGNKAYTIFLLTSAIINVGTFMTLKTKTIAQKKHR